MDKEWLLDKSARTSGAYWNCYAENSKSQGKSILIRWLSIFGEERAHVHSNIWLKIAKGWNSNKRIKRI